MSKAFTLIELLVVISIIVLITALTLPNYRSGNNQLALQRSAHRLSQDLRRAQEFAISAKEFNGDMPGGYGVYFDLNQPEKYILFADIDGVPGYSGINEKVEEISLENNLALISLTPMTPQSSLTVFFTPPRPTTAFTPAALSVSIILGIKGTDLHTYTYVFNGIYGGHFGDRAVCDTAILKYHQECPESGFPASASDPAIVYDWWLAIFNIKVSWGFEKQDKFTTGLQKTVEVNYAGLIAVD